MAISRRRSALTGAVLLVIVLALFGAAGYYVWRSGGFTAAPAAPAAGSAGTPSAVPSATSSATAGSTETTAKTPTIALSTSTARDVVDTLLLARQAGDATTLRLVTTAAFQVAHSSWYDGRDNSAALTDWAIERAVQAGAKVTVTVSETWSGKAQVRAYTVVREGGDILVSATAAR